MFICMACGNQQQAYTFLERIPVRVDDVTTDAGRFLEKIEIVPLETNDSILFGYPSIALYDKESDMYAFASHMNVFTFTGKGNCIGSSISKRGQGPDEYTMMVDMKFNHYFNGIDLLNPYGTIYTYSPKFELIAYHKVEPEFPVTCFMPLDSFKYVFSFASIWADQETEFINLKTGDKIIAKYQGTVSGGNGLYQQEYHKLGDDFYFIPNGVNYHIYRMDTLNKKISPIAYLDFGKAEIKEEELPGRPSGKRVDNNRKRMDVVKDYSARHNFIRESLTYVVPMRRLFNDKYIYVFKVKGQEKYGRHYIYNREKREGYLIKVDVPFRMYPCFEMVDNILFAVCEPTELAQYVERRFMSDAEIVKMEQLKEDDNPVVIKYYLKR